MSLRGGLGRRLLRSPMFYSMGWRLISAIRKDFSLEATGLMAEFALRETGRAFAGREPVAWSSAFAPVEILYALGIVPFSPEAASAVLASLGLADLFLREAEGKGYSRDECSFHRAAMGAALMDYFPRPDFLICSSHLCDGAVKLFWNARMLYGRDGDPPELYLIDTPWGDAGRKDDPVIIRYLASQMEDLYHRLSCHPKVTPDPGRLREAILFSNEARRWALKVNEIKRESPCPLTAPEVTNFIYMLFMGFGSPEAVTVFRQLYEEAQERLGTKMSPTRDRTTPENYRILWLHLKPFYPTRLWAHLERNLGAKIVFDEFSQIYWDELDPDNPFESLARKALSHFGYGCIANRVGSVLRLALDYRVDGVVHFSHWGCRQSCGGVRVLKDELARVGIPMLILDGDCIDNRNYSEGQVMTRLEGFLEMLEGRRSEVMA